MNKEIKALWISALLSGDYKQTTGALCRTDESGNESYCCLGVLTELAVEAGVIKPGTNVEVLRGSIRKYADGSSAFQSLVLPRSVMHWAGLRTEAGEYQDPDRELRDALSSDNDRGVPFDTIAKTVATQF